MEISNRKYGKNSTHICTQKLAIQQQEKEVQNKFNLEASEANRGAQSTITYYTYIGILEMKRVLKVSPDPTPLAFACLLNDCSSVQERMVVVRKVSTITMKPQKKLKRKRDAVADISSKKPNFCRLAYVCLSSQKVPFDLLIVMWYWYGPSLHSSL